MAIYTLQTSSLKEIQKTEFKVEEILEKELQNAIEKRIEVIAPNCLVISKEFSEWEDSQRRIDLLAIDKKANLVVIEFKRTKTGAYMELQSLRYAAMVSTLTFERAVEIYQGYLKSIKSEGDTIKSGNEAKDNLLSFLEWKEPQEDEFALDVRSILVSEDFSTELTTSVMWLNEKDIDINCTRLIPYKHQGQILMDVQQIIPLPEAEEYQTRIKEQSKERKSAHKGPKVPASGITREIVEFYITKIKEGAYSKKELRQLGTSAFPNNKSTASTVLNRGFYWKECQFPTLLVEVDGIVRFSEEDIIQSWVQKNMLLTISGK